MKSLNFSQKLVNISLFLMISVWSSTAIAKTELSSMRIGQTADKTRVVFDLKQMDKYKVSQLSNPSRLVVDFYQVDNKLSFRNKHITDKRLSKIRISDSAIRTRVVLDLHQHSTYKAFTLSKDKAGRQRLVVDLGDSVSNSAVQKRSTKPSVKAVPKVIAKVKKPAAKTGIKAPVKKNISPLVKMAKVKPQQQTNTHRATQNLLNRGSSVFSQPKTLVIAIDAGHGGKDVGAVGHNDVLEKVATLSMAKELKRLIDLQPGMRAILTRDKDVFIPLGERVKIAKKQNADMFVSIHADAFHDNSVRGGSVYILSRGGASSVMARLLAKSENASLLDVQLKGRDDDVAFALSDLTREANVRASRKLAHTVLNEMQKKVKMHKHSVQSAKFAVLKSIDMPSLLIETAFISNPHEARNLMNKTFQTKMASAIASGLTKFVAQNAQKPRWGESLYVHYKVQKGDTLSQIAANYDVSTQSLKKINNIKNANALYVGKKVKILLSEKIVAGL
ncbi:MAG: N-acetylmuramoyl-L-alanine amidase [Pseudomonadota bacterium]